MRRFFALLLLLSLFSGGLAQAEEESDSAYTHPSLGYSFELPADWIVADETSLTAEEKKAVQETGLALFIAPDGSRLAVVPQSLPLPLTAEQFMSMMMSHQLTELEATVEGITFPDHPSVYYTHDDRAFCYLTAVYPKDDAVQTLIRYFLPTNDFMYVISFTVNADLSDEEMEETAYEYKWLTRGILDTFFPAPLPQQ